jgi:hypothetical protein
MQKRRQRAGNGPATRVVARAMGLVVVLANAAAGRAESWKRCSYNDSPIPRRDSHSPDGTLRITWQDGQAMTYRLVQDGFPISTLRGIWQLSPCS